MAQRYTPAVYGLSKNIMRKLPPHLPTGHPAFNTNLFTMASTGFYRKMKRSGISAWRSLQRICKPRSYRYEEISLTGDKSGAKPGGNHTASIAGYYE